MEQKQENSDRELCRKIGRKQVRKMRARKESQRHDFWLGLSMFGLIGWSVAIPTLLLTAVGLWLDSRFEGSISWTITGIFAGVISGCLIAWYWIRREGKS